MRTTAMILAAALLASGCSNNPRDPGPSTGSPGGPIDILLTMAQLLAAGNGVSAAALEYELGQPTTHSSPSVPPRVPDEPGTEITCAGVTARFFDAAALAKFEADFPVGEGPNAVTVAGDKPGPLEPGFYMMPFFTTVGDIPTVDNGRTYQYATVFDRDRDPSNNFVPVSGFENDWFGGTDTWLQFTNIEGDLNVTFADAQDNDIRQLPTHARAMIDGNAIMFMIPMQEFDIEFPCYLPWFRSTAFCHAGDFGFSNPWSGSVRPPQDEPLAQLTTEGALHFSPRIRFRIDYLGVREEFAAGLDPTQIFTFEDEPFVDGEFFNGHMMSVAVAAALAGGKDGGLNVVPAMAERGTPFPCLRLPGAPEPQVGGFISFPVMGEFHVNAGSFLGLSGGALDDGFGLSVAPEGAMQDPLDLEGVSLAEGEVETLIAQAMNDHPDNVHFRKEVDVLDDQIANVVMRNELVNVPDLRADFRAAVEAHDASVTQVHAGLPLRFRAHATPDMTRVDLHLRIDTRAVVLERTDLVDADGTDYRAVVAITQAGRREATLPLDLGRTLLLAAQRDFGAMSAQPGIPILMETPIANHEFAPEISESQVLLVLIRPTIVMPEE